MKKIAILVGLMASFLMFAGCASKACEQGPVADTAPVHQDVKGETGGAK